MVEATSAYLNKPLRSIEQVNEERRLRELAIHQSASLVIINEGFSPCDIYAVYQYNWHDVLMRSGIIYQWGPRRFAYTALSGGGIYPAASWTEVICGIQEILG